LSKFGNWLALKSIIPQQAGLVFQTIALQLEIAGKMIEYSGITAPYLANNLEVDHIASPIINARMSHDPNLLSLETHPHSENKTASAKEKHAFYAIRYYSNGSENPDFILNKKPYRNASILLSGVNFGIGSMQVMATARLLECGFRIVVAQSFGPTFFEDSVHMGLLPIQVSSEDVSYLAKQIYKTPDIHLTVNLEKQVLTRKGSLPIWFSLNDRVRDRFIHGSADKFILATYEEQVKNSKEDYLEQRPWIQE
jgi:3-isopropylmalate/(R)-2-methylmalate dehydratase small subunit